jgi:hypothetical protein
MGRLLPTKWRGELVLQQQASKPLVSETGNRLSIALTRENLLPLKVALHDKVGLFFF